MGLLREREFIGNPFESLNFQNKKFQKVSEDNSI